MLYHEKFLFTIKRNSLAVRMGNNNNNNIITIIIIIIITTTTTTITIIIIKIIKSSKYPVIVSRSPRNALRFFHWALLL